MQMAMMMSAMVAMMKGKGHLGFISFYHGHPGAQERVARTLMARRGRSMARAWVASLSPTRSG